MSVSLAQEYGSKRPQSSSNQLRSSVGILDKVKQVTTRTSSKKLDSALSSLRQMKTEPAVSLLASGTTWRDFFDGVTDSNDNKTELIVRFIQEFPEVFESQVGNAENLERLFVNMIQRIEDQWYRLKIPTGDRDFYRASLLIGPPKSLDHCREVAKYIVALREHGILTVHVLNAITTRELVLAQFYETMAALDRKLNLLNRKAAFERHAKIFADLPAYIDPLWETELIDALIELQSQTVDVIERIRMWRLQLWRPQAFMWKGMNYMLKIKTDLLILDKKVYNRQLMRIPLVRKDLLCLLFGLGEAVVGEGQSEGQGQSEGCSATSIASAAYPWYSDPHAVVGGVMPQSSLRLRFTSLQTTEAEYERLALAAREVEAEEAVQSALREEKKVLASKALFIPSIKIAPIINNTKQL